MSDLTTEKDSSAVDSNRYSSNDESVNLINQVPLCIETISSPNNIQKMITNSDIDISNTADETKTIDIIEYRSKNNSENEGEFEKKKSTEK